MMVSRHQGWLHHFQTWTLSHRPSDRARTQLTGQDCDCKKTQQNLVFAECGSSHCLQETQSAERAPLRPFTSRVVVLERTSKCQAVSCSPCSLVQSVHTPLLSSALRPTRCLCFLHMASAKSFFQLTSGSWPCRHTRTRAGEDWAFRTARRCRGLFSLAVWMTSAAAHSNKARSQDGEECGKSTLVAATSECARGWAMSLSTSSYIFSQLGGRNTSSFGLKCFSLCCKYWVM